MTDIGPFPEYRVRWSVEDQEFVATCDWFPSMSWLDRDCVRALEGLADALMAVFGEAGLDERKRQVKASAAAAKVHAAAEHYEKVHGVEEPGEDSE